jgi:aminopeptidase N
MRKVSFALGISVFLGFAANSSAATLNNPIHVIHYDVEVSPDFKSHAIAGKTEMKFESLVDGLEKLSFSTHELKVSSVQAGSLPAQFSSENSTLTIAFAKRLKRGQKITIAVEYQGTPQSGITFGEHSIYTAYDTCHWMICDQDNPGDKATLQLTLNLPKDLQVIASGKEVNKKPLADGLVQHVWREDRPYSAYVFGFTAGQFQVYRSKVGNTELGVFSETVSPKILEQEFQDTGKMIQFFEEKSGVPFPHPSYEQIVVPGDEAQEVSSFSVIGTENVEPIITHPKEDWAIVHELAHQWWGNLITCKSWDHFWLNEGMVVFLTAAYKEARWGKAEYDREMEVARKRYQFAKDQGFDLPLTKSQLPPTLKLRRAIAYSKGALFLDTLREQMGEDAFWSGLKAYSKMYVGKTVESQDFQKIMESKGGPEVTKVFNAWVY